MSIRKQAWHVLNDPDDVRYRWFHLFINTLIIISVFFLVYEAYAQPDGEILAAIGVIDSGILVVFLIEYLARLWVIRRTYPKSVKLTRWEKLRYVALSRLRFVFSPWGFIDFLALLPLFPFLRSLRILRLLRLFRSAQFFRFARPMETLFGAFRDNSLLFLVSTGFVVTAVLLSAFMLFLAEYRVNDGIGTIWDTLWWSVVTITTVGFGDITPVTPGGRAIGAMLMFAGMFVVAMFAGVISSTLVGHLLPLQQEQVRMSTTADHIIVAGWNDEVPMMLVELEREFEGLGQFPDVVLFSNRSRPTNLPARYSYVQGDFTKESEFDKVRLSFARTVVVVADDAIGEGKPGFKDGTTVLTVFTIRSYMAKHEMEREQPLHVVAEILDSENRVHAEVAGADEVIETTRVGSSMLAHTAGNPGVGAVISNIVLASRNNLYSSHLPANFINGESTTFRVLQEKAQDDLGILVIGLEHHGKMRLNPPAETVVYLADNIIYLGPRNLDGA